MTTEQVLVDTPQARVRVLTLKPGEQGQWHRHTEVEERVVCLEGVLTLHTSEPNFCDTLYPGQLGHAPAGRRHRVLNTEDVECRYLLIQGPGRYDFVVT